MTIGRIPNIQGGIQPTIIDAKGDLITGVSNDTPARLGVGADGTMLIADSTQATGLNWAASPGFTAGKNRIINGDFGVWQRGTSFTLTTGGGTYTADRWRSDQDGTGYTKIISQQAFTYGTAPVTGYEGTYFMRINQSVAGSGQSFNIIGQFIEDVRVLANQTFTFSFWAKAATNTTIGWGWGQEFGTGGSAGVFNDQAYSINVTTSWQRFTLTGTFASIAGKTIGAGSHSNIYLRLPLSATYTIDTWGWQLEAGSVATPFTTATGTVQGELAACQRYYYRVTASSSGSPVTNSAGTFSTTETDTMVTLPVPMRVAPTSVDSNALAWQPWLNTSQLNISSIVLYSATNNCIAYLYGTISGGTANQAGYWRGTSSSGYLGLSAEL